MFSKGKKTKLFEKKWRARRDTMRASPGGPPLPKRHRAPCTLDDAIGVSQTSP